MTLKGTVQIRWSSESLLSTGTKTLNPREFHIFFDRQIQRLSTLLKEIFPGLQALPLPTNKLDSRRSSSHLLSDLNLEYSSAVLSPLCVLIFVDICANLLKENQQRFATHKGRSLFIALCEQFGLELFGTSWMATQPGRVTEASKVQEQVLDVQGRGVIWHSDKASETLLVCSSNPDLSVD
jgi:hypothetical protein